METGLWRERGLADKLERAAEEKHELLSQLSAMGADVAMMSNKRDEARHDTEVQTHPISAKMVLVAATHGLYSCLPRCFKSTQTLAPKL